MNEADVVYGTGAIAGGASEKNLQLDIYQPDGPCEDLRPYVLMIHGGGFVGGDKRNSNFTSIADALSDQGLVAVSIDYRLAGDDPRPSPAYEALEPALRASLDQANDENEVLISAVASAIEDTVTAINWVEENGAERCIDASNFAILGSSAGAFTGAAVSYGLDDFSISAPAPGVFIDYWGALPLDDTMAFGDPPLFILHGDQDRTVSYSEALDLEAAAEANGVPYSFYTVASAGHGFGAVRPDETEIDGKTLYELTFDFIDAHLRDGAPVYEVRTASLSPSATVTPSTTPTPLRMR